MSEVIVVMSKVRYVKPNMGALKGRLGREIIEIIKNTPVPDRTKLYAESEEIKRRILAAKANRK